MKIEYYISNIGVFLKEFTNYNSSGLKNYKFNGIEYDIPKINGFYHFQNEMEINTIEQFIKPQKCIIGFELKISTFESDKIKAYINLAEVSRDSDGDWMGEYESIRGLYKEVYSNEDPFWEMLEVEHVLLGNLHITDFEAPQKMGIKIIESVGFSSQTKEVDLGSIVRYNQIGEMLTPEFLLHDRPCILSSDNVYKIVRQHIIENINGKFASITSNYDFCFTVKKKVKIKPIQYSTEVKTSRGRSYIPPRFVQNATLFKEVEIFEMCPSKKYNKYTVIAPWHANSLKEMNEHMKIYLEELMDYINMDLEECPHCNGTGHIVHKISTNEREISNDKIFG
jgi:hypothetical protein